MYLGFFVAQLGVFWYIWGMFLVHYRRGGVWYILEGFLVHLGVFWGTIRVVFRNNSGGFMVQLGGFYGTIRGVIWYN